MSKMSICGSFTRGRKMTERIVRAIRKVHYNLDETYGEYTIACYYTYWRNQGDIPMPNWDYTEKESKVTCKRCLGMFKTDFRSID